MSACAVRRLLLVASLFLQPGFCLPVSAQINTDYLMTVGRNAIYFEDYVLSIQYFNKVINTKPYLNEPYFFRGLAKFYLEDYAGAEQDCGKSIELNPFVVSSYQVRGMSRVYMNKYNQAADDFRKAIEYNPVNQSLWHNLILCQIKQDNYILALSSIDTLLSLVPRYTPAMSMRSGILLERKDTAAARESIERALAIDKFDASLYQSRALINITSEYYSQAEFDLNKAIGINPSEPGYYVNRALTRYHQNNVRGALSDYDQAISLDAFNVAALYNRALMRGFIGDDNRAIEDFDRVIELEPDNMLAIFNRAQLRDQTGNLEGAISDYTAVLNEYPHYLPAYELRAAARYSEGDLEGAEQDQLYVLSVRTGGVIQDKQGENTDSDSDAANSEGNTRKESDRNVRDYKKFIMVNHDTDNNRFTSDYRGKVQNKNVEARYLTMYYLTYFQKADEIDRRVRFSSVVEDLNRSGVFSVRLLLSNTDHALDENEIATLFNNIDSQTANIERYSGNPFHLLARAINFYLLQNYSQSEADLNLLINSGSAGWAAYFCRATVRDRMSRISKARDEMDLQSSVTSRTVVPERDLDYQLILNDLNKVISLVPDFAYAHYNKANIEASAGNHREAVRSYDRAIELDESFAEAYYNRGLTLILMERVEQGVADLSKAGELGIYSAYNVIKRFSPNY